MIVLVVAVGVGARIFKNTMLSGATQANMSVKRMLFLGAVFGGIQVLMVSLGLALTWTIDNVWGMETVGGVYRMMALICLCLLMLKGLKESIHMKEFCECRAEPVVDEKMDYTGGDNGGGGFGCRNEYFVSESGYAV